MVCDGQAAVHNGTGDRNCIGCGNGGQHGNRDAVEIYGGEHAQAKIIAKSILRYVIVVIVFFVMMKFNLGNLFTAFIGVLGLKISAYLQPFTHKFVLKLQGRVETPSESSDN